MLRPIPFHRVNKNQTPRKPVVIFAQFPRKERLYKTGCISHDRFHALKQTELLCRLGSNQQHGQDSHVELALWEFRPTPVSYIHRCYHHNCQRKQLIFQFLTESTLLNAVVVAGEGDALSIR